MSPPDVMTAAEAAALLDGWPHDPEGDPVGESLTRALRAVVALHARVTSRDQHAAFYMRQAFVFGVAETRRLDAAALLALLPDAWERLRDAPEPEWPTAGVQPEAPDDAAFRAAWQAGAEATRAADVAALRAERLRLRDEAAKALAIGLRHAAEDATARSLGAGVCADIVEALPLPAPSAPPQCPEAPPDGGTEPGGGGAPARGLPVAAADNERRERLRALDLPDALRALAAWVES